MKWKERRFKDLGYIARGRSRNRPRNEPSLYGGQYPFIQTGDIKAANLYVTEYSQTYNDKGLAQSKLWPKNTLCITIAANIAETALLGMEACFPDSVIGFIADDNVSDVRFIKYFFDIFKERMKSIAVGAAQDNLSMEKLETFTVPAPDVKIQRRIGSILSAYDDLIENNVRRIKLLEEAAEVIYSQQFGFYQPTNANVLPSEWHVRRADEIFTIKIGRTPPREQAEWFNDKESNTKWVSIRDMNNPFIFLTNTNETLSKAAFSKFNINIAKANTVLLSFKLTVGKVKITTEDMATNEAIAHFNTLDEGTTTPYFTYFYLKRFPYDSLGSTSSIGNAINSQTVKSIPILLPDAETMAGYQTRIEPYFKCIKALQFQNVKLRHARDILLPKLMSGEIDIQELDYTSTTIELAVNESMAAEDEVAYGKKYELQP